MVCSFPGCGREVWAKGLCGGHYGQRRKGLELTPLRSRAPKAACSFPGCQHDNSKGSGGFCGAHWLQVKAGKTLTELRDFGLKAQWIIANAGHQGGECLVWPFPHSSRGRGAVKMNGLNLTAPKAMCIVAHGPAPTKRHQAAHSCGKGHLGCLNPKHLRWATVKENAADRAIHGTQQIGEHHPLARLTQSNVLEIRRLAPTHKRRDLAMMFGVSYETIIDVVNYRSWRHI